MYAETTAAPPPPPLSCGRPAVRVYLYLQVNDLASTADEVISLVLSFCFLICSSAWVCKSTRDRSDIQNELWNSGDRDAMTRVILHLARGTGPNVLLCLMAFVGSILLTFICIWKSSTESFDSTLKLLLTMVRL
jgi:hypothetical protein